MSAALIGAPREQAAKMARLYMQGVEPVHIAERLGLSLRSVHHHLQRQGMGVAERRSEAAAMERLAPKRETPWRHWDNFGLRRRSFPHDQAAVDAWIAKHGVTLCPPGSAIRDEEWELAA